MHEFANVLVSNEVFLEFDPAKMGYYLLRHEIRLMSSKSNIVVFMKATVVGTVEIVGAEMSHYGV